MKAPAKAAAKGPAKAPAGSAKKPQKKADKGSDDEGDDLWCGAMDSGKATTKQYTFPLPTQGYMGPDLGPLAAPLDAFRLFMHQEVISLMVDSTNDFGTTGQYRSRRWTPIDQEEFEVYIGIVILMGVVKMPSYKDYWDPEISQFAEMFKGKMTCERFGLIQTHLHCAPSTVDDSVDKVAKAAEFLRLLKKECESLWVAGQHEL